MSDRPDGHRNGARDQAVICALARAALSARSNGHHSTKTAKANHATTGITSSPIERRGGTPMRVDRRETATVPARAPATDASNDAPSVVLENTAICATSNTTRDPAAIAVPLATVRRTPFAQPHSIAATPRGIAAATVSPSAVRVAASGEGVNGRSSRLCRYLSPISAGLSVKSAGTSHATAKTRQYNSSSRSVRVDRRTIAIAAVDSASISVPSHHHNAAPAPAPHTSAAMSRIDGVRDGRNPWTTSIAALSATDPANAAAAATAIRCGRPSATVAVRNSPIGTNSRTLDSRSVNDQSAIHSDENRAATASSDAGSKLNGNTLPQIANTTNPAAVNA